MVVSLWQELCWDQSAAAAVGMSGSRSMAPVMDPWTMQTFGGAVGETVDSQMKCIINDRLVNIQKTMENNHFQWENFHYKWSFSIAS